jgi:hypothetical protein
MRGTILKIHHFNTQLTRIPTPVHETETLHFISTNLTLIDELPVVLTSPVSLYTQWVRLPLSLLNTSANVLSAVSIDFLVYSELFLSLFFLPSSSWRLWILHLFMQLLQYLWQGTDSFLFWEMMVTTIKMREPTADRHYNEVHKTVDRVQRGAGGNLLLVVLTERRAGAATVLPSSGNLLEYLSHPIRSRHPQPYQLFLQVPP